MRTTKRIPARETYSIEPCGRRACTQCYYPTQESAKFFSHETYIELGTLAAAIDALGAPSGPCVACGHGDGAHYGAEIRAERPCGYSPGGGAPDCRCKSYAPRLIEPEPK